MTTAIPAVRRRTGTRAVSGLTRTGVVLALTVGLSLALSGPASADVPEGWPVADDVDLLMMLGLFVGLPLLMGVVIVAFVYLPAVVRGESVKPGSGPVSDQWLGGPRKSVGELSAPDDERSEAGGGSGRW